MYLLGTPNGRWGDGRLARVSTSDILEPAAYEYWTGERWHPRDPFVATPTRAAIVLRTAEELTGP